MYCCTHAVTVHIYHQSSQSFHNRRLIISRAIIITLTFWCACEPYWTAISLPFSAFIYILSLSPSSPSSSSSSRCCCCASIFVNHHCCRCHRHNLFRINFQYISLETLATFLQRSTTAFHMTYVSSPLLFRHQCASRFFPSPRSIVINFKTVSKHFSFHKFVARSMCL